MATDRQIKTRISQAVEAFREKDWEAFISAMTWLQENLDERQKEQYQKEIITRLDEIDPGDDADAFFFRGNAKNHLRDYQGAIADFDKAIRLDPDYAEAFTKRGDAKAGMGDYFEAIADYDEALKLRSDLVDALHGRGVALSEVGDHRAASKDFDRAIEQKPDYAEAFYNRGLAKSGMVDYVRAIADFNQAIEQKPKYAEAFYGRGLAKERLGSAVEAITDFDEAIRLKPDFVKALNMRGLVRSKQGNYEEGLVDYEEVLRLDPENTDAVRERDFNLRRIDDKRKKDAYDESLKHLQNPIEISKRFESHISESKRHLRHLRHWSTATFIFLFLLLLCLWIFLASIVPTRCLAEVCSSYSEFLRILSITLTTSFLASPLFYFLRRIHHDMRVERAMLEDFRRKWTMLNLRLLERDMVEQNTAVVMDHFDQHGTPEVLAETYAGKSSTRRDDRFIEKLAQRIADLLARQSS